MKELVLSAVVLFAIGTLIVPIPPGLLDLLLSANLLFALILLVSTFSLSEPLKLSSFPIILLLGTLFRLALNISTTRSILSTGNPGQVVETFGKFVIQGNLAVGIVIFLIITIVQFLVIAKGAERVAEVSARFALDALPGRQMSIDADVRAGLIDFEAARLKRQDLQSESRFYGALDGAMKFVKGDCIAAIIITAINIVGGIMVGVVLQDLPIEGAIRKFTLLSVGDALLSQIPALMNAVTAGMMVTRVTRGNDVSLGQELVSQVTAFPVVFLFTGVVGVALACVPGMPVVPFLALSLLLVLSAGASAARERKSEDMVLKRPNTKAPPLILIQAPAPACRVIEQEEARIRREVFDEIGLLLPPLVVEIEGKEGGQILMRGIPAVQLPGEDTSLFAAKVLEEVKRLVNFRKGECIDDILTRKLLDYYESDFPELMSSLLPHIVTVTQLTTLLRGLLEEGVSIRNFEIILQAVAENGGKGVSSRTLLEHCRASLRRVLSAQLRAFGNRIEVIGVEAIVDVEFVRCEQTGSLPTGDLIQALTNFIRSQKRARAILASRGARALLRDCIRAHGFTLPVYSHDEIVDIEIKTLAIFQYAQSEALLERLAA